MIVISMNTTLNELNISEQTNQKVWPEKAVLFCRLVLFVPSYLMLFTGLLATGPCAKVRGTLPW